MSVKSTSKTNNQSRTYKVNGLLSPSKEIFEMFKDLDEAFTFIVENEHSIILITCS